MRNPVSLLRLASSDGLAWSGFSFMHVTLRKSRHVAMQDLDPPRANAQSGSRTAELDYLTTRIGPLISPRNTLSVWTCT
jgi:hypothetical protein